MTLLVHTFVREADGSRRFLDDPDYARTMAGFESTRDRLWGAEAARALGARFLPRLDGGDLCVEHEEIADFLAECENLRPYLPRLATEGGYRSDYVAERFADIVTAALRARTEGGGIIVW
ncbi:hypothetical protein ACGFX4_34805 [Kitasatospora sp. NPDC048365]|uniref:hypothetical protein n=1 Tax=Kitasatospora sp. NPDC048365 TaxID=3364050 RepID=UPI003723D0EB